jgi:hypothetical protein
LAVLDRGLRPELAEVSASARASLRAIPTIGDVSERACLDDTDRRIRAGVTIVAIEEPVAVTSTSHYFVREDGIVIQAVVSSRKQTLVEVKENLRAYESLVAGRRHLLIVDMRVNYSVDPQARAFYATPEASRFVMALAMVTPSTATRIIGNFFLGLNQPAYPCRMFAKVDDAVPWLHARAREIKARGNHDEFELR